MKLVATTIAVTSLLILPACNKTNKAVATTQSQTQPAPTEMEMDVQVEVGGGEVTIMINGEEQNIDIRELLGSIDIEGMNGDMNCFVVDVDSDDENGVWVSGMPNGMSTIESHIVMNGEEVEGLPEDMMQHVMKMIANGENADVDVSFGWSDEMPEHGNMQMMRVGGPGGGHGDMRAHMMNMMGGDRDGGHGDMHEHKDMGEHGRRGHERDVPEEIQFIEELGLLGEVSVRLEQNESVALMGIHMIRDELEGDVRLAALEVIIEESLEGSSARNAALFVAIQTMQEEGDDEGAAEYMIELVLSN